jgi:hypothetical protein
MPTKSRSTPPQTILQAAKTNHPFVVMRISLKSAMFNEINAPVGGFFAVVQYVIQKATVGGRENTDSVTQTERNAFHERCSALGGCGDVMSQQEELCSCRCFLDSPRLRQARRHLQRCEAPSSSPPWRPLGAGPCARARLRVCGGARVRVRVRVCVWVCMWVGGCARGCTRARAVAEHYHADTRPPWQTEETTQTQDHHGHVDTRPPRPRKEKEGVATTRVVVHTGRTRSVHVVLKMLDIFKMQHAAGR